MLFVSEPYKWAQDNWAHFSVEHIDLWNKLKAKLDKHKKRNCVRCRYKQNKYFHKAYKICTDN